MARRLPIKPKKKAQVEVARTLRLTKKMDELAKAAADARGIPLTHWIRQAIVEKLQREGGSK